MTAPTGSPPSGKKRSPTSVSPSDWNVKRVLLDSIAPVVTIASRVELRGNRLRGLDQLRPCGLASVRDRVLLDPPASAEHAAHDLEYAARPSAAVRADTTPRNRSFLGSGTDVRCTRGRPGRRGTQGCCTPLLARGV